MNMLDKLFYPIMLVLLLIYLAVLFVPAHSAPHAHWIERVQKMVPKEPPGGGLYKPASHPKPCDPKKEKCK